MSVYLRALQMRSQELSASSCQNMTLNAILKEWSPFSSCPWPGCRSRASFYQKTDLKLHVTNTHINPLVCKVPDCIRKDPFGRPADLKRHERSVHPSLDQPRFVCPVSQCEAVIKDFARKDHLIKHIRERHGRYLCPLNHCRRSKLDSRNELDNRRLEEPFLEPTDVDHHIEAEHGIYECHLMACADAPPSKFNPRGLQLHLKHDHGSSYPRHYNWAQWDVEILKLRNLTVADANSLPQAAVLECKHCIKTQQQARSNSK